MKICKSCGAELVNGVCEKCGWGKEIESKELSKIKNQAKKMKHHEALDDNAPLPTDVERGRAMTRKQLLLVVILVVIAGIIFIMYKQGVFAGKTYEEKLTDYFGAIEEFDFDKYTGAMQKYIADEYEDELKQFGGEKGAYMRELYADYIESYSESFDISYTILNRDSWVKEDLDYMEEYFSEYHKVNADVTQALSLTLEITISGANGFTETSTAVLTVAKVDGKWGVIGSDY